MALANAEQALAFIAVRALGRRYASSEAEKRLLVALLGHGAMSGLCPQGD